MYDLLWMELIHRSSFQTSDQFKSQSIIAASSFCLTYKFMRMSPVSISTWYDRNSRKHFKFMNIDRSKPVLPSTTSQDRSLVKVGT